MPSTWLPPRSRRRRSRRARTRSRAGRPARRSTSTRRAQPGVPRRLGRDAGRDAAVDTTAGEVLLYNGNVARPSSPRAPAAGRSRRPTRSAPRAGRISSPSRIPTTRSRRTTTGGRCRSPGRRSRGGRRRRPHRRRDRQTQPVAPREDAQGHVALAWPAAHGHRRRRHRRVGARAPLDVVQRRRPLPAAAVPEPRGGRRHARHVERRRPGRQRRRRAEVRIRWAVDAVPVDPGTGAFHFTVKPKVTTRYRLATRNDAAAPVRIRVQAATVK